MPLLDNIALTFLYVRHKQNWMKLNIEIWCRNHGTVKFKMSMKRFS